MASKGINMDEMNVSEQAQCSIRHERSEETEGAGARTIAVIVQDGVRK